jgi:predicted CXXCH cytochrome family protein
VRRWTLLLAGAALWLFLAAIPALADGGPHKFAANNGTSTLTADGCAGCHRAHTAQGPLLLAASDEEALCLTCHGTAGTGATVNVEDGVQYSVANNGTYGGDSGPIAGALRGGGFVNARISSSTNITRLPAPRDKERGIPGTQLATTFSSEVKVLGTGSGVTSAHLLVGAAGITETGVAWGNGTANSGVGQKVTLGCASCHNPHGNGAYRILVPIPSPPEATAGTFVDAGQAIYVNEVRPDPTTGTAAQKTRNYTVQWGATLEDVIGATAYNGVTPSDTLGDYWRINQPYNVVPQWTGVVADAITNPADLYSGDMPEFIPPVGAITTSNPRTAAQLGLTGAASVAAGQSARWRQQMTAWCSTCHTRYNTQQAAAGSLSTTSPFPDTRVTTTNPADNTSEYLPGGFGNGRPYVSPAGSFDTDSGDAIYKYRHGTQNRQCTICHVAHGSNAKMPEQYSGAYPYPDATGGTAAITSGSSRLLKVDNRGTCQQCHDPTGTITWNSAPIIH